MIGHLRVSRQAGGPSNGLHFPNGLPANMVFCPARIELISAIHTPSCIWRRTGEIQKANQEFANLTHIPASMFRNGQLCVYELMDEDSAVRYWEGYAKIAFDAGE